MNNICLSGLAATLLCVSGARAETVTYSSVDYYGYGAGEIGLMTANGIIEAFCIDPTLLLLSSGTYDEETLVAGNAYPERDPLSGAQVGEIGALVLSGEQWIASGAPEGAAAIAIAIWRVEGYGYPYSLSSFGDATSAWINSEADFYYNAVTTGALAPDTNVNILYQDGNQPLVTLTADPIPEASTWLMMLAGFLGLGWRASRTRSCARPRPYGQSARALGVHLPKPLATMLRMTAQT